MLREVAMERASHDISGDRRLRGWGEKRGDGWVGSGRVDRKPLLRVRV
jgi:hypothetical protein